MNGSLHQVPWLRRIPVWRGRLAIRELSHQAILGVVCLVTGAPTGTPMDLARGSMSVGLAHLAMKEPACSAIGSPIWHTTRLRTRLVVRIADHRGLPVIRGFPRLVIGASFRWMAGSMACLIRGSASGGLSRPAIGSPAWRLVTGAPIHQMAGSLVRSMRRAVLGGLSRVVMGERACSEIEGPVGRLTRLRTHLLIRDFS
ncbi:hypothetical protein C1I98_07870 [Spongiactinospora gelatinilytica]|uniref:Uncharacterized protein n=1 Tax=Spongiactinospora gelatinilytica TaxID=2666298 RepID=A0A2W2HJW9_9ACTN|nr:hypothetical protein C1I98_07870 [Spongiactinospora gelatinilytica]